MGKHRFDLSYFDNRIISKTEMTKLLGILAVTAVTMGAATLDDQKKTDVQCYSCFYNASVPADGVNKADCADGGDLNEITVLKCGMQKGCGVMTQKGTDREGNHVDFTMRSCFDFEEAEEGCINLQIDTTQTELNGQICYSKCTEDYCNGVIPTLDNSARSANTIQMTKIMSFVAAVVFYM